MLSIVCLSFQLILLSNLLTISRSLVFSLLEVSLITPPVVMLTFKLLSWMLTLEAMPKLYLRILKMLCSHGTLMDTISSSWGKFLVRTRYCKPFISHGSKFNHFRLPLDQLNHLLCDRMDGGQWIPASRLTYNLRDTISRCTVQVAVSFISLSDSVLMIRKLNILF